MRESVTPSPGEKQHPFEAGQGFRQGAVPGKSLGFTDHMGKIGGHLAFTTSESVDT